MNSEAGKATAPLYASSVKRRLLKGNKAARFLIAEVLVLVILYWCGTIYWYNEDMTEINNIMAAESKIQNECKRRDDLIPNLTNIARDYARHERALFKYVSDARAQLESVAKLREGTAAGTSGNMEDALSKLIALSEQYPELKAAKSYLDLMETMETTENRIASTREMFIERAKDFDMCNQRFWCNFFTYPVTPFMNLPAYIDYFHTDNSTAPLVRQNELSGVENEIAPFNKENIPGLASQKENLPQEANEGRRQ